MSCHVVTCRVWSPYVVSYFILALRRRVGSCVLSLKSLRSAFEFVGSVFFFLIVEHVELFTYIYVLLFRVDPPPMGIVPVDPGPGTSSQH